ncbi:MAG: acylphosphatase [Chitinispirillaceae bacterium]
MGDKRYHVYVSGRVQGVGYRFFTRDVASFMELGGWVRNTHDGRVELEVQGEQNTIDAFLDRLREGPPLSRVNDLSIREVKPSGGGEFLIRR